MFKRFLVALLAVVLAGVLIPAAASAQAPAYITQWGTSGSGDGQFNRPWGIAVDGGGNVYVADTDNHRIQKFTSSGTYLTRWGTHGHTDGQFYYPYNVAVDASGNVYVADTDNERIQKFTNDGTYVTQWGTRGSGDGQFYGPDGVAVDASGNVYVGDYDRIQKFTSSGTYVTQWGSSGTGNGQFSGTRVAVDGSGNFYVADHGNDRIQVFGYAGADVPGEASLTFALDPVRPNPSRGGALTVRFSLPTAAPARLELLDVAGRRIASREVDSGQHTLDLGVGQHLAPGLYLVRLTQGVNTRTARVAVLR
jgi:hypothetical protein